VNYKELVDELEVLGWHFKRNGKGSHRIFERDGQTIPIPCHSSKDIPIGTAKNILKKAGKK